MVVSGGTLVPTWCIVFHLELFPSVAYLNYGMIRNHWSPVMTNVTSHPREAAVSTVLAVIIVLIFRRNTTG